MEDIKKNELANITIKPWISVSILVEVDNPITKWSSFKYYGKNLKEIFTQIDNDCKFYEEKWKTRFPSEQIKNALLG